MTRATKSSCLLVAVAWIFVGVPAGWGIYNTLMNSAKLFRAPAAVRPASSQK